MPDVSHSSYHFMCGAITSAVTGERQVVVISGAGVNNDYETHTLELSTKKWTRTRKVID